MAAPIRFDEAFTPSSGAHAQSQTPAGAAPITFDDAIERYEASKTPQMVSLATANARQDQFSSDMPGYRNLPPKDAIKPPEKSHFGAAVKSNLVEDPQTKRRLIAESVFPDDPNGINRVGLMDGRPVYVDDEGQLRFVSGGIANAGAKLLASAPEAGGSVVGSFATGNPVTGTALGAAAGRGVKRGAAELFFDEPVTPGGVVREMATEGAVNAATAGLGKGVAKFADRGRALDFTPQNLAAANRTRDSIKATTGIDADLAQASGNRKLTAIRAYAARFPGKSSEMVQAADEVSRGQLDSAVSRVMDTIAKSSPAEVAGAQGMNAARMVMETAKATRDKAVAPLYETARNVELAGEVVAALQKDPVLRATAARVQKSPLYQRDLEMKDAPAPQPNSVGFWHYVQQDLDDQIAKAAKEPNKARILSQARKDLNKKLESASPEFAEANARYGKVTRETIDPLEASAVGVLARITSPKAATAAARIFSDKNITATDIRTARALVSKESPDAWNGLVRQWISRNWDKSLRETQAGEVSNPAGKLRQSLVGTPEQRNRTMAMLPQPAVQAFDDLMTAAESLARTPTAGSNTMRDTEIRDQLRGTGSVVFKWLTSPRQAIRDSGEQAALEKNTLAITEAILDPSKQKQLRQVVRMAPSTRKAIMLTAVLGGQSLKLAAEPGPDAAPAAYQLSDLDAIRRQYRGK